jgi:hypothetical protein
VLDSEFWKERAMTFKSLIAAVSLLAVLSSIANTLPTKAPGWLWLQAAIARADEGDGDKARQDILSVGHG